MNNNKIKIFHKIKIQNFVKIKKYRRKLFNLSNNYLKKLL